MGAYYGFIYITTNMINGKKYLGQKKFDCHSSSYIGSGKALKKAIHKYGRENFSRSIVCFCHTAEELNKVEYDLSLFLDVVASDDWYNQVYGGGSINGYRFTEEAKRKIAQSKIGKSRTDEDRKKLSLGQKRRFATADGTMLGKKHSIEAKKRMSQSRKGLFVGDRSTCASSVIMICPNGNQKRFGSIREAERETGVDRCTIQYRISVNKPDKNGVLWQRVGG